MISSRQPSAAAGVRLLLLTVLLGLFAMHVLSAHGGDHHGVATAGSSFSPSADHPSAGHDATSVGAPASMVHHTPVGPAGPAVPADAAGPALPAVLVGAATTASAGDLGDGDGLPLCWLLLTAGVALLVLLLRGIRPTRRRVLAGAGRTSADPSRPRAPPGRARLHELVVLRV